MASNVLNVIIECGPGGAQSCFEVARQSFGVRSLFPVLALALGVFWIRDNPAEVRMK